MPCGCNKNKTVVASTTAEAEANFRTHSSDRYKLVGGEQDGETFANYVQAKSAARTSGGKVRAI